MANDLGKILDKLVEGGRYSRRKIQQLEETEPLRQLELKDSTSVASAATVTLGQGNYFDITGAVTINNITLTGWTSGAIITLRFAASLTITHEAGGDGQISLCGGIDLTTIPGTIIGLILDSTTWREIRQCSGGSSSGAIEQHLLLPGLRGFWPMSGVDASGDVLDFSENALTLTNNNGLFSNDGLAPIMDLSPGASYLSHADTAALDILGTEAYIGTPGLTLGGWYRADLGAPATRGLMSKYGAAGQRGYSLVDNTAAIVFTISDDGTNTDSVTAAPTLPAVTWKFIVGKFIPSTSLIVLQNDTFTTSATVLASVFNNTASFYIGSLNGGDIFNGDVAMQFICAYAVPNDTLLALYQQTRGLFGV